MHNGILLGASLMCADLLNLQKELSNLDKCGVDYVHFDVMDGYFVPNFGLNLDILKSIKKVTSLPINVHLMVEDPSAFIEDFAESGCNSISFHQESTVHVQRVIKLIKGFGIQVGLALNPATPLTVLEYVLPDLDFINIMTVNPGFSGQILIPSTLIKIKKLRQMLDEQELKIAIQVDGNVSFENIPKMIESGANMLVCGTSSLYKKGMKIEEAIQKIKSLIS